MYYSKNVAIYYQFIIKKVILLNWQKLNLRFFFKIFLEGTGNTSSKSTRLYHEFGLYFYCIQESQESGASIDTRK